MQKTVFTKEKIDTVAREILGLVSFGQDRAAIVALSGDLGAGKTTLAQAIARELGVKESVISPTFVIMKSYPIVRGPYKQLIHIDAYRLNSETELEKLGWAELAGDPKNLILIEWP